MTPFFPAPNCQALLWASDSLVLGRRLSLTSYPLSQNAPRPVTRRRALLASNPLRNSRLETHRDDEGATPRSHLLPLRHHHDRFPHASENALAPRRIAPFTHKFCGRPTSPGLASTKPSTFLAETGIGQQALDLVPRDRLENGPRVVGDCPQVGIKLPPQFVGGMTPRPAEI